NDSITMWGNYNGQPSRSVTVIDAIREKVGAANVTYRKVSEWVAREEFQSLYNRLTSEGRQGMKVQYWNNPTREGEPVVIGQLPSPFNFCTLGNTVFAPGVNLTDFSAKYEADFHATESQTLTLNLFTCGIGEAAVLHGNDTICRAGFRTGHGSRRYVKDFRVVANENYRVVINYAYYIPDAQLNFDLGIKRETDIAQAVRDVADADVIIYVGGISPQLEGEEMKVDFEGFKGGDRENIQLPRVQRETLAALHKTGKRLILVNMSGCAIGLEPETRTCDAILQAWYPGQAGGVAVADVLFGDYNPAGRLPVTFYKDVNELPDYHDYNVSGHTYRYYNGRPTFAFGYGLSYSTFSYGRATLAKVSKPTKAITKFSANDHLVLRVPVTNTSTRDGEEVVQLYLRKDDDSEGPIRTLRGFRRQLIPAGQTVVVEIPLDEVNFRTYNEATGQMQTTRGSYTLYYGGSSRLEDLQQMSVSCK
ncbi:MAG: glycoside hydrolase family 3 C-terminal domain-containing protein, partial [Bacteroidales bacterium]|nr:glycoside hydrolase family 3 C-terminal domain-containing protein [Bacteroidales bacterium]